MLSTQKKKKCSFPLPQPGDGTNLPLRIPQLRHCVRVRFVFTKCTFFLCCCHCFPTIIHWVLSAHIFQSHVGNSVLHHPKAGPFHPPDSLLAKIGRGHAWLPTHNLIWVVSSTRSWNVACRRAHNLGSGGETETCRHIEVNLGGVKLWDLQSRAQ